MMKPGLKLSFSFLFFQMLSNAAVSNAAVAVNAQSNTQANTAVVYSFGHHVGERLVDVKFKDVDGRAGSLAQLAGKRGAIIVMRDAECPVSQRYAPRLAEFEKEYTAPLVSQRFS